MTAKPIVKVSAETYNELYDAARAKGWELGANNIFVEKGDMIERPIDYRLAAIRKDCLIEAVKMATKLKVQINIWNLANEMYHWILTGKYEQLKQGEWK